MAGRYPLIRTIYLYLFALLGLVLLTIGSVRFVNMGLKAFVFTQAEQEEKYRYDMPTPYPLERLEKVATDEKLTDAEREQIKQWLKEQKEAKEERAKIDYRLVRRHQDASMNIALILVGFPLYLYHWRTIKKEMNDNA
jgi:hypothetical protein